ncbi:hypothetical protein RHSIM_Rhsim08G0238600 [Rhododendron simsii]|uniref:Uncharacterized protein n=1 Tax=Rhododendron simsii TaxID=118357 RepID=A0A834GHW3_RHOSS|nr:hypothetical protein RHSIM_Rhsim08G0238600 [Rhododendron simsii]
MEDGIDNTAELQCGDIFHLCALVSSRECEFHSGERAKKLKSSLAAEGEIIPCRGKGFPGIMLSIHRATMSTSDTVDLFKDGNNLSGTLFSGENDQFIQSSSVNIGATAFPSDHIKEILYEGSNIPTAKAGDQGLSMEEVSKVMNIDGTQCGPDAWEFIQELIVEYRTIVFASSIYCPLAWLIKAEKGTVAVEDDWLIEAEKGTVPVEDDWLVKAEDDEMVAIEEIDLFLCQITREFVPEKLTTIVMNGMESYEQLAASIHLAWSAKAQEEFHKVLPDIGDC